MNGYPGGENIDDYRDVMLEDPMQEGRLLPLHEAVEACPPLRTALERAVAIGQLATTIDALRADGAL